jgi:hypothetical protein
MPHISASPSPSFLCAGSNRRGVMNERVTRYRASDPRRPRVMRCSASRGGSVEALTGVRAGPGLQPRKKVPPGCRRCKEKRKATPNASTSRDASGSRAVRDPVQVRKHPAREPGGPVLAHCRWSGGPRREVQGRTPTMNERGKSDGPVVALKSPNKAGQPAAAEEAEGRGPAKGNLPQQKGAPHSEPTRRAKCAGAGTSGGRQR